MEKELEIQELSAEVKEVLRESAMSLVEILLLEQEPFRLVIWNNNNWNAPLPDVIQESFPVQLVLDIKEQSLQESYIDPATGEIIICTVFEGEEYLKVLKLGEIIAILGLEGQPYILNDFVQEDKEDELMYIYPKNVDEMVNTVSSLGIPKEAVEKSMHCFMKNNPGLINFK